MFLSQPQLGWGLVWSDRWFTSRRQCRGAGGSGREPLGVRWGLELHGPDGKSKAQRGP